MRRRFTDEQEREIGRRYKSGRTMADLARLYSADASTIREALRRQAIPVRPGADWRGKRVDEQNGRPSNARLIEEYTVRLRCRSSLAAQYGVSDPTVRRWLLEAGIALRTLQEQRAIDGKLGRRRNMLAGMSRERRQEIGRASAAARLKKIGPKAMAAPFWTPEACAARNQANRRRISRPCGWCGVPLDREASHAVTHTPFCSQSESGRWINHRRWHPNEPRPIILQRLAEAMAALRKSGLPISAATLRKAGEPIGAGSKEYAAWLGNLGEYDRTQSIKAGAWEVLDEEDGEPG